MLSNARQCSVELGRGVHALWYQRVKSPVQGLVASGLATSGLDANAIDIGPSFANEFEGMTRDPVPLKRLLETRQWLMKELPESPTESHRRFLAGLVRGEPDWSMMQCPHLQDLPALRWKLENLTKLKRSNPAKFDQQAKETEKRLL